MTERARTGMTLCLLCLITNGAQAVMFKTCVGLRIRRDADNFSASHGSLPVVRPAKLRGTGGRFVARIKQRQQLYPLIGGAIGCRRRQLDKVRRWELTVACRALVAGQGLTSICLESTTILPLHRC